MATIFLCEGLMQDDSIEKRQIVFDNDIKIINSEIAEKILKEFPAVVAIDIPEGVEGIAMDAFSPFKDSELKKVTIPRSVRTIYSDAFRGCKNLEVMMQSFSTTICVEAFEVGTKLIHIVT